MKNYKVLGKQQTGCFVISKHLRENWKILNETSIGDSCNIFQIQNCILKTSQHLQTSLQAAGKNAKSFQALYQLQRKTLATKLEELDLSCLKWLDFENLEMKLLEFQETSI